MSRSLLGERLESPALPPTTTLFAAAWTSENLPWLADHRGHGIAVVLAAAFVALAVEAGARVLGTRALRLDAAAIHQPLAPAAGRPTHVQTILERTDVALRCRVLGRAGDDPGEWTSHFECTLAPTASASATRPPDGGEALPVADLYAAFATRGVEHGRALRVLEHLRRGPVTGTTGWHDQIESVKQWCSEYNGALVYASNFSIGVNLFFELYKRLGLLMKPRMDYEPFLTVIHHTQKKDAPSGTAITLANDLLINSTTKSSWVNITDTPPHSKPANPDELIILSRRQDDVVGNHSVEYRSADDRIEIRHEAFSRDGFAKGALAAAGWIRNRKGCYTFSDIMESI